MLSSAKVEDIFNDYFNTQPLFGAGNKKSGFADAFVLNAFINTYAKKLETTSMVSNNPDWKNYMEQYPKVRFFNRIPELIVFIEADYDAKLTNR